MPKKKKFIDKKNAVTFHLVHRSQQDPLIADENAPQRVLLPASDGSKLDNKKRLEEQHKYGIFFDDDYNYLQHLQSTDKTAEWEEIKNVPRSNTENNLKLPSSVFASNFEEEVGLLNKAAPIAGPRIDLDPDIVAAMDEDFNYSDPENQLEDNFIELANAECTENAEYESDISSNYENEERDEIMSLKGESEYSFNEEETKSRFTNYSMSSSVIRRNENLTLLDDRFEKMYIGYDENEIGALDCEEIEGHVPPTSDILLQYADEFEKYMKREKLDKDTSALKKRLQEELETDSDTPSEEMVNIPIKEKEKWDCESIISTYSNIYNHPKLITEPVKQKIKINMKTGMPINILNSNRLTSKALAQFDEENKFTGIARPKSVGSQSVISTLSTRPKNESPQERKERKRMLKDYRKERRCEKKLNSLAFKEEAKRQVKISMNNKNNTQGNKIL